MTNQRTHLATKVCCAAITASVLMASAAQASLIDFDLEWSGADFGNTATASGTITIDDAVLFNPGFYMGPFAGSGMSDFSVTISGANTGNGTFTSVGGDFSSVAFESFNTGVDFSTELVGQAVFGDFNVFAAFGSGAPTGTFFFQFATNEGAGDTLVLTSMRPAVPAPGTLALLGLGGLSCTRRRR